MTHTVDVPDLRPGRRRRFTHVEKVAILTEAASRNETLSAVGRRYGIAVSLLFRWKKTMGDDLVAPAAPAPVAAPESSMDDIMRAMRALEAEVNWLSRQNRRLQDRVTQFESTTAFVPVMESGRHSV